MNPAAAEKLSDRQIQCLLLVAEELESKEIARRLGLSHHTVNTHVAKAIQRLGAYSRDHAVELLLAPSQEASSIEYTEAGTLDVVPLVVEPVVSTEGDQPDGAENRLHDVAVLPAPILFEEVADRLRLPVRTTRRPENELTTVSALVWPIAIAVIVIGLILATGGASDIIDRLSARYIQHWFQ